MRAVGVFFDLDGTLWDDIDNCFMAWREVLSQTPEHIPYPDAEQIRQTAGKTTPELCESLMPGVPAKRAEELIEACFRKEIEYTGRNGGVLYPHVEEMLASLSDRCSVFLVSNCDPEYLETFFRKHGLRRFFRDTAVYTGEGHAKADNIRELMARYALACPVYVGDTVMDYRAATAAGVPFIHAAYGFGRVPEAKYRIETPADLPALWVTFGL